MLIALENFGLEGELDTARNGIFVKGRKISGNTQGRFNGSVMINGSFLLDFDFKSMDCVLKHSTMNLRPNVTTAREGMVSLSDLMNLPDINHIKQVLRTGFEEGIGVKTYEGKISAAEEINLNYIFNPSIRSFAIFKIHNAVSSRGSIHFHIFIKI